MLPMQCQQKYFFTRQALLHTTVTATVYIIGIVDTLCCKISVKLLCFSFFVTSKEFKYFISCASSNVCKLTRFTLLFHDKRKPNFSVKDVHKNDAIIIFYMQLRVYVKITISSVTIKVFSCRFPDML